MNNELPLWFKIALQEVGTKEISGHENNERIVEYASMTSLRASDDETSWCSAFVCWCLEKSGVKSTKSAAARSYLTWGLKLKDPVEGCIVVFKRGSQPWQGHVAFFVKNNGDTVSCLGGNQNDMVDIAEFKTEHILGYRWPKGVSLPTKG